jgi:hypothetical protein
MDLDRGILPLRSWEGQEEEGQNLSGGRWPAWSWRKAKRRGAEGRGLRGGGRRRDACAVAGGHENCSTTWSLPPSGRTTQLNSPCVTLMYSHGCRWNVCTGFDKESTRAPAAVKSCDYAARTCYGQRHSSNREKRWAGNVRLSHARCTLSRLYLSRPLARSRRRSYSPPVMHAHTTATASWPSCCIAATAAPDIDLHLWCVPPASRCPGGSSGWRI